VSWDWCPYCAGSGRVKRAATRVTTGETSITREVCPACGGAGVLRVPRRGWRQRLRARMVEWLAAAGYGPDRRD
jgi:hypothetical protein